MNDTPNMRKLARQLAAMRTELDSVKQWMTRPQLPHSSLDDASVPEKDESGTVVSRWGKQADGTHGVVDFEGPTPPAPAAPTVEGGPGLLTVTYGGVLSGPRPLDLARVEAYASTVPFEYIEDADLLGSITGRDGGRLTVTRAPGTWHVALVAVSRAEKRSAFSALAVVEVLEAGDSEAVERLAKAFHTDTRPPTPEDGEGRPEGAYWTMLDATGAEEARWRWVGGEWVDAPLSPDFIPEAYVDHLAANQGLIQELLTHNVDVAGDLRLAGSLYAQQETYGLELTAGGIDMSSQGLTYLGDQWFLPQSSSYQISSLAGHIVVQRGEAVVDFLEVFDAQSGTSVREIRAAAPYRFGRYHYVDAIAGLVWIPRLNTSWEPVDLVAYNVQGSEVATVPVAEVDYRKFAVSADYVAHENGSGVIVRDRSGTHLRTVPFPGGSRFDPTDLHIDGDVLYEFYDSITRYDLTTGDIVDQTPLPGYAWGVTREGDLLVIPTSQMATGSSYLVLYSLATGSVVSQMQIVLGGGGKRQSGGVRVDGDLYVMTYQDAWEFQDRLWSIEAVNVLQEQQTQALIDTVTGSVRFNNAILTGVTQTDVTAASKIIASRGDRIEFRDTAHNWMGFNRFYNLAQANQQMPNTRPGVEITTWEDGVEQWVRTSNQQWVRVWSEDQADTGWIDLQLINGWTAQGPAVQGVPGVRRIGKHVIFRGRVAGGSATAIAVVPQYSPQGATLRPGSLTPGVVRDGAGADTTVVFVNAPGQIAATSTSSVPNLHTLNYYVE